MKTLKNPELIFCLWFVLALVAQTSAQSTEDTYIKTYKAVVSITGDLSTVNDKNKVSENIGYFDALGRPSQSVMRQASPLGFDVVSFSVYDEFGRAAQSYLPYTSGTTDGNRKQSVIAEQNAFYENIFGVEGQSAVSTQILENSALGRVLKQGAPGSAWQPKTDPFDHSDHAIKREYATNLTNEVLRWTYDPLTHSVSAKEGGNLVYYVQNELAVTRILDEHNNRVIEYTDKFGKVVLKRVQAVPGNPSTTDADQDVNYASTYYIYDERGNLATVLPPQAVSLLATSYHNATTANQNTFLTNWAFRYKYDGRNRMTVKSIPGAGDIYMVYDSRDRLVLTQDAKQRSTSTEYWTFTKYDELNRPVLTGIKDTVTNPNLTQAQMQGVVDGFYAEMQEKPWRKWGEKYVGNTSADLHGYTNNSYPVVTAAATVHPNHFLTVMYYDNYEFKTDWPAGYDYVDDALSQVVDGVPYQQPGIESNKVKGLTTGSKVKVLDGGVRGGYTWLNAINYYDDDHRLVQTIASNYQGGFDRTSSLLDFSGKVLQTKTTHSKAGVMWKDIVGAIDIGNKLYKNISGSAWNTAGAVSVQQLAAGQDGWLEVTASETNLSRMIGFSDQNTNAHHNTIDYAFYMSNANLNVYENGSNRGAIIGGYQPYDRLRISRVGTTIHYYRNDDLVYTSTIASSSALMVDVAFYTASSSVTNVRASFASSSNSVTRRFEYDHAGRLLKTWHRLNSEPEILLTHHTYDEIGQLVDKKLHSTNSSAADARQSIDYIYNIRGWLSKMNETDLTAGDPAEPDDFFSFELGYNNDIGLGNQPLFNGNISGMKWSNNLGLDDVKMRGYAYDYDAMNRIADATFREGIGNVTSLTWSTPAGNSFSESGYTYDLNGNLQTLQRKGKDGILMDNLSYYYGTGTSVSNKLLSVTDAGDDNKGFVELNTTGSDYGYDANGNMTLDRNKGGKDLIVNGDFSAGSSSWVVTDAGGRLLFQDGKVDIALGASSATLVQSNKIQPSLYYVVVIDMERTSPTGSVTINVGGTNVSASASGVSTFNVTAGTTKNLTITIPANSFSGSINSIEVQGLATIAYNFLNLPEKVTKGGDRYLSYVFDATGRKLAQEVHTTSNVLEKRSNYAGEFFYENDTLKFINHDEGRIVMTDTAPEYQYHLKDHLGNVRLTFTTADKTDEYTATMEDDHIASEQADFPNYDEVTVSSVSQYNHTAETGATKSVVLNGADGKQVGLAKSLRVVPGDVINMEVYAKYFQPGSTGENVGTAIATAMTAAFSLASGSVGLEQSAYQSLSGMFSAGWILDDSDWEDVDAPKAFLNYILFDEDFIPYDMGWDQIHIDATPTQSNPNPPHDYMDLQARATKPGYIYIYFSNEDDEIIEVYFDDFRISHVHSPRVQADDYYPFGLTFNSFLRAKAVEQTMKFNSKEEQRELNLGWIDFGPRMYMPDIGRWASPDILSENAYNLTPYRFGFNNPIRFLDPNGLYETDGHYWTVYLMGILHGIKNPQRIANYAEAPDNIMTGLGDIRQATNTWVDFAVSQGAIHSLTGASAASERAKSEFLASNAQSDFWFGIWLHRLGDSYAHTRMDGSGNTYDGPIGHAFTKQKGHAPDKIANRPELYLKYVSHLSTVMGNKFGTTGGVDLFTFEYIAKIKGSTMQNSAILETEVRIHEGLKAFSVEGNQMGTINDYLREREKHTGTHSNIRVIYTEVDRYTRDESGNWQMNRSMRTFIVNDDVD